MRRLCLLSAFLLVLAVPFASTATAAPVIQPGVAIVTGDSYCTLNWIYDGAGVYGGTAAHCVERVGQRVSLADATLGEPILDFGSVAFIAPQLDYAFIRIDSEDVGLVNPALKGYPNIPQGVSTKATAAVGDIMQFSGQGVGFHLTQQTQEQRKGVLGYNDGTQHYVYGPVISGDSGGPVADVTDGNKAFGIVNTVGVALTPLPQAGEGGISLQGLLADAAARGFPVSLRTV